MTNAEILEKAIQKAIDGGWTMHNLGHYIVDETGTFVRFDNFDIESKNWDSPVTVIKQTEALILNHDFAKALWGDSLLHDVIARDYSRNDKIYWTLDPMYMPPNNWQFHLQQMVISDDPLQYLADNLGE